VRTAHLPISPSKSLLRFADQIASNGKGLVLDAPCGYGRNAVALAARGCAVVGVDNDRKRLAALEQVKAAYIRENASANVSIGKIFTVCADLEAERWPFAPASFSAVICIHFAMVNLVARLISSLQESGCIYVETFGGHGENFRVLPKAGQLRKLFSSHVDFKYYNERQVGPVEYNRVSVTLFAQKRKEQGPVRNTCMQGVRADAVDTP
jgi:SAM-dependent methyltransferase